MRTKRVGETEKRRRNNKLCLLFQMHVGKEIPIILSITFSG